MRRKTVLTYVVDEGHEIDFANPTARGYIDVPVAGPPQYLFDDVCKTNRILNERVRKLELELQQAREAYDKLSSASIGLEKDFQRQCRELETAHRIRVNCEEKLRKIDDIISPF